MIYSHSLVSTLLQVITKNIYFRAKMKLFLELFRFLLRFCMAVC
jgi:hypothetical protein